MKAILSEEVRERPARSWGEPPCIAASPLTKVPGCSAHPGVTRITGGLAVAFVGSGGWKALVPSAAGDELQTLGALG
jgi:hypothetical protein